MQFASDNTSGAAPEILAALAAANEGHAPSYGADPLTQRAAALVREVFEAPEAAVHLVATGTAANALSLAICCPPWATVYCHARAHVLEDECGAPEFFTAGARLVPVGGDNGRMTPAALRAALESAQPNGVHGMARGAVSLSNVTESGTVYSVADLAALTAEARRFGLPVHMDGARLANALVATGASAADMTWRAGIDVLSLGGTKNGCLGVEAVVIFDPARSWEFELRRKRAGHLVSKHRFLGAQMAAWLEDGLWLRLAARANRAARRLAAGLSGRDGVTLASPAEANMVFVRWPEGTNDRLHAAGAHFYPWELDGHGEGARLVAGWNTRDDEIDRFLSLFG